MGWVPHKMWFTYLQLHVAAGRLGYDLAVSTRTNEVPALAATGVSVQAARPVVLKAGATGRVLWPIGAAVIVGLAMFATTGWYSRRRRVFAEVRA